MSRGARVMTARLAQLAGELPARYTTPLSHLGRVRVLTGAQLNRLLTTPDTTEETTARVRRRVMARLCELGLVTILDRRIGGVRAGSAGHVYTLTTAGHRFLAFSNAAPTPGRVRHARRAPGRLFLAHALTISDIYVDLVQASSGWDFCVATFTVEPQSWWPLGDGTTLRPDAYTVLQAPTHRDCWWLEIDQATESLPRLRAKCRTYADFATYGGAGPDGVLPRVLFTAPTQQRAETITTTITAVFPPDTAMLAITTHHQAADFLITELTAP